MQKLNSALSTKLAVRRAVLKQLPAPIVMETHGGNGEVFKRLYSHYSFGVVMEKEKRRAAHLTRQRPGWAVYCVDSLKALQGGVLENIPFTLYDIDPFGDPWPHVDAILDRPKHPGEFWFVVNDGLRKKAQLAGAWDCASLQLAVQHFGNGRMPRDYGESCHWLMQQKAEARGFSLLRFYFTYAGYQDAMTHYYAQIKTG